MAHALQTLVVVLACVFLQRASSAESDDITFAVTVSSQVTGGTEETFCAVLNGATEPVTLTISLLTKSRSTVLLEAIIINDFYQCNNFKVPVVRTKTVATIKVGVSKRSGSLNKETKILIVPPAFIHIIQTDKPIYKPGQTIQFRIVSMDSSFIPAYRLYSVIELQDSNSNRIAQWLNKIVGAGILDLSHPTIAEAPQGTYTITATTDKEEQISHSFEIKEYVLPKFEVTVHLPSVISIEDEEITLKICGKYTYGKPVAGSVKAVMCRNADSYSWRSTGTNICKTYTMRTDRTGCATEMVNIAEFALNKYRYEDIFVVSAELEEDGTGVTLKGSGRAVLNTVIRSLMFIDVAKAYLSGINFEGKVKMTGPGDKPVANAPVYLLVSNKIKFTLITNTDGLASFSLDTSNWKGYVNLQASSKKNRETYTSVPGIRTPDYRDAYHSISPFYSKSNSYLKLMKVNEKIPCDKDATVQAQYIIQGEALSKGQEILDFYYLVMSKGAMVQHGRIPVAVKVGTVNKGVLSIPLHQVMSMAPFAQIVIYTLLPGGETVADSQDFPIQLCLKNKVSLKFSNLQELPAAKTTLKLQAQPGSLCSVRAIDQSILLLQSERELTVDYVYNQLPLQRLSGYSYEIEDFNQCLPSLFPGPLPEPERLELQRGKRSIGFFPITQKIDIYSIFKAIGVKLLTNSDVRKTIKCFRKFPVLFEALPGGRGENALQAIEPLARKESDEENEEKEETIRTFFPETWIWDLVSVGDKGIANVEKTVPDTITKWAAGAFCVSSVGFGVAPNTGLIAFQPFFVSLTLPFSVVRGEAFTLKATVFNYLSKCIMVKVTLTQSEAYTFRNCYRCQYTMCVCGEESKTFSWIVTPTALGKVDLKVSAEALKTNLLCGNEVATVPEVGRIDTVIRTLLVEAEGTPQSITYNAYLCPADGITQKEISLVLPKIFIVGSERGTVSVLGDLMGRALENLENLLKMPYGCGEQNMLRFAPNIFILNYLKVTGQLTPKILAKTKGFLESGYQRELTYKHDDGSYSAFGKSDASGNTWLTAFVMKSFGGATSYIFVDPKHILDAKQWLFSNQGPDGCIKSVGRLFHNGMKGGVSDDVSLTAYIVAALLELDSDTSDPAIQKCLGCLKNAYGQLKNLYTTALMSYTFTLARDQDMRSKLIKTLHQQSITNGGTRHWTRGGLHSLEVEMTSYVLMALLGGPTLTNFGLGYSIEIVRWLTDQQNSYGGFSSTQDTVVALQALAKYAELTYSVQGRTVVTVTSVGLHKTFTVDQTNRLLFQEETLSNVPGVYNVHAEGQSCVLVQITMDYNIPPPPDFSVFYITAKAISKCNPNGRHVTLLVEVRYQGRREETNMVIINIKLLSGYILAKNSLDSLREDRTVKRVDVEEGYIDIYLDGLRRDELVTYSMTLDQEMSVTNLKAAAVKVYDYYQTSDVAVTEYTSPCKE
ncbi:alpha-2-macroglobulin-like protein 1 [Stigmatopora argus]